MLLCKDLITKDLLLICELLISISRNNLLNLGPEICSVIPYNIDPLNVSEQGSQKTYS
jgi:hypothetical protein